MYPSLPGSSTTPCPTTRRQPLLPPGLPMQAGPPAPRCALCQHLLCTAELSPSTAGTAPGVGERHWHGPQAFKGPLPCWLQGCEAEKPTPALWRFNRGYSCAVRRVLALAEQRPMACFLLGLGSWVWRQITALVCSFGLPFPPKASHKTYIWVSGAVMFSLQELKLPSNWKRGKGKTES